MIAAIHQPNYLPWLGFVHKMAHCDAFVLLDNVQFVKDKYQHRNKIKTPAGWMWLTIPVKYRFQERPRINEICIDLERNAGWARRHWKSIALNYGRAPHFRKYASTLEEILCEGSWRRLVDVSETLIRWTAEQFGIRVRFFRASELGACGQSTDLLVDICRRLGADAYLAGPSGKKYMEETRFAAQGIALRYQRFEHPQYSQLFGGFIPNLCMLDLLFNHGEDSLEILLDGSRGRKQRISPGPAGCGDSPSAGGHGAF